MILATKVHGAMSDDDPNQQGNSRRWIIREVEESLRRLKTDYIDLYQLHRPRPETDIDETLSALSDLHAGKVRYIGDLPPRLPGRSPLGRLGSARPSFLVPPTGFEPALPPSKKWQSGGVLCTPPLDRPSWYPRPDSNRRYRLPRNGRAAACSARRRSTVLLGTPDRIRTGATALRGRRARPLHNGGSHCVEQPAELYLGVPQTCQSPPFSTAAGGDFAGILGLEPRLTGPEPVVLPITPYPTVLLVFGPVATVVSHRLRAGEKPYTRRSEPSKTFRTDPLSTARAIPSRRAAQIASAR